MTIVEMVKKLETIFFTVKEDVSGEKIEDGILEEYKAIRGATDKQLEDFEQQLGISLTAPVRQLYQYKNGSGLLSILFPKMGTPYRLMELDEILRLKSFFQNTSKRMDAFDGYYSKKEIAQLDKRIKPYLFHEKWVPFATMDNSLYLMLDFAPSRKGKKGQIIKYIHDPDWIEFVAGGLYEALQESYDNIAWNYVKEG